MTKVVFLSSTGFSTDVLESKIKNWGGVLVPVGYELVFDGKLGPVGNKVRLDRVEDFLLAKLDVIVQLMCDIKLEGEKEKTYQSVVESLVKFDKLFGSENTAIYVDMKGCSDLELLKNYRVRVS